VEALVNTQAGIASDAGGAEPSHGVQIGYYDASAQEFTLVDTSNPLPISGTVTVGNSVTIGSLPAISGTVTANQPSEKTSSSIYSVGSDKVSIVGGVWWDQSNYIATPIRVGEEGEVFIGSLPAISGTVTANNPSGALTTRFGSVTTANTAQLTSAVTNTSRKYLLVQNIATSTVTIGIGFAPTTTQGIQLTAGAGLTFDAFCPTGGVWWLSSTTGSNFSILEG
jgi:hypothetical protein